MSKQKRIARGSSRQWWYEDDMDYGEGGFAGVSQAIADQQAAERIRKAIETSPAEMESRKREEELTQERLRQQWDEDLDYGEGGFAGISQAIADRQRERIDTRPTETEPSKSMPPPLPPLPSSIHLNSSGPPPLPPPSSPSGPPPLPPLPPESPETSPIIPDEMKQGIGFDKQNALLGAIMGEGSLPGMAGGAIGGAIGGPVGAMVGSGLGRVAGAVATEAWNSASVNYSKADLSSYMPGGSAHGAAMPGNDTQIVNLLQSMQSSMRRVADVGVRTTGGKPNIL